jgi:hypothetical protein
MGSRHWVDPDWSDEKATRRRVMREIKYHCNFCHDIMGLGYGVNWSGSGGGNTINLVTDNYNAKQLENHICLRCDTQIAKEVARLEPSDESHLSFG